MKKAILIILFIFIIVLFFSEQVLAAEEEGEVTITQSESVAYAKLINKPNAKKVQEDIYIYLTKNPKLDHLIIDGEFGRINSSNGSTRLSNTNIETLELKNSNVLPAGFYSVTNDSPSKLTNYSDDGTVRMMYHSSLVFDTPNDKSHYENNKLNCFKSAGLKTIYPGVFDGYKGKELYLSSLESIRFYDGDVRNNFYGMPNVEKISLPSLQNLKGTDVFSDMPKLKEVNLGKVTKITSTRLFDNKNEKIVYVDLSSLNELNESEYIGNKKSDLPMYIKVNKNHPNHFFNDDTNAIFYTGLQPTDEYTTIKGCSLKISSIGENNKIFYGNKGNVIWYIDGKKSRYTGSEIDLNTEELSVGNHILTPIILYGNKEEPDFFKNININVIVNEDKTNIETKNSTLYVGQKWNPKDNFVNATDEEGKSIPWEDSRIIKNGASIDNSKPGKYKIKYTFQGKVKNMDSEFTVTVLEDQTKAELKDTELYVGQKWGLESVFKNVVDKDGNPIKLEEVKHVWIDGQETREIDTSKPGKHIVQIAVLKANNEWAYSNKVTVTVTVKEQFTIKQVPYFDFEDHILVSTNKPVANKKENPTIELETPSIIAKDWQLQVELSPFLDKKNSKSILKGVSLYIPKGKLESDLETEEPTQYDCQLEANGKASILMQGTKTKGKGRWENKLATKEITLSIPPENKKGNYESTLHWTLLDVPG
ncbi:TPA: bacterial Ig-like domain-containing protein [Enterococcus faecalis]